MGQDEDKVGQIEETEETIAAPMDGVVVVMVEMDNMLFDLFNHLGCKQIDFL